MAALFGLLGGQIALGAVGQLDEEGLLGVGARLDLVAVVEEELERVGGDGDGAEADDVALGVEDVHLFLQLLAAEDAEVDLQRGRVIEVDVARLLGQIVMDAAARGGDLGKGRAAQRQLHHMDLMDEFGVGLRGVEALVVDLDDLVCNALAGLAHAGQVEHRRIGLALVRVGALEVRIVHVAFRLDPADEVDRALVARGGALRQQEDVLAEMLTQEHLGLAPEVGGDEQPVLDALRRARKVRNDAGQLVFLIKDIHQLDAGVVAALDLGELRGLGVAPHLGGAVVIAHAAAHADDSAAERVREAAGGALCPRFERGFGDLAGEELQKLVVLRDLGVGGDVGALHILLSSGKLRLQKGAEAAGIAGEAAGGIAAARIAGAGMGVDGGDDDLHRVKAHGVARELFPHGVAQRPRNADKVAAAEDSLVAVGAYGHGGHAQRFFHVLGNALGKLADKRYLFIRCQRILCPADLKMTHNYHILPCSG